MAKYSIEDTTLTNIADAIREKMEGKTITHKTLLDTKISKTSNATGPDTFSGSYASGTVTETVTIPGADYLVVKLSYQTEGVSYDYVQYTANGTTSDKLGGKTLSTISLTLYTDTITFTFKADGSSNSYLGYYAEVKGYTAVEEDLSGQSYTPVEMPSAIALIGGGGFNTKEYDVIVNNEGTKYSSKYTFFPNISDYYDTVDDIEFVWFKVQEKSSYVYIKGICPIYPNGALGTYSVVGGSYSTMKITAPGETYYEHQAFFLNNGIEQSGTINGYPTTMLVVKKGE